MVANVTKQTIEYVGDTKQAERSLRDLSREQEKLVQEFKDGNRTFDQAAQGLRELGDDAEDTIKALRRLRAEQEKVNSLERNQSRFDRTSERVALAGDFQSNLGAISGLAGAAGAGGVAQGVGLAGELTVLVEELPRLKASVQGLPAAASAAAEALGIGGGALGLVGALGAAAVAVVAVQFALKELIKLQEREAAIYRANFDAQLALDLQIANNLITTEEATARLEQLNAEQVVYADYAERATQSLEDYRVGLQSQLETMDAVGIGIRDVLIPVSSLADNIPILGDVLKGLDEIARQVIASITTFFDPKAKEIQKTADEQTQALTENKAEHDALTEALDENRFATADAIKAEEEAARAEAELAKQSQNLADTATSAANQIAESGRTLSQGINSRFGQYGKTGGGFAIGGAAQSIQRGESEINNLYQDAYKERAQLVEDHNRDELRIYRDSLFDRKQAFEQYQYDQNRLLESGSFGAGFDNARDTKFQFKQIGDRLKHEADTRRNDFEQALTDIATEFRNMVTNVKVSVQTERGFSAQATVNQQKAVNFGSVR